MIQFGLWLNRLYMTENKIKVLEKLSLTDFGIKVAE